MGIAIVFALSYNLLLGQTGLLSFGHAVYFGLGGFAAIHFMRAINAGLPVPMPLVPLVGAATGLAFGLLFGAVTTRRAGVVFALISLGIGELVFAASRMLQGFSGGEEGITANRAHGPSVFGLNFASQLQVYYIIAFWVFVAAALMYAFTRTPVGRMCNAVRDNPERAAFVGYSTQGVRFIVFSVAAMFAGLAGGLHAINYEIVAADAVGAARSGSVLLMVYIGGEAHYLGADSRRDHDHLAAGEPQRLHDRMAALSRVVLHGDRAVRAGRSRRPDHDACADPAHAGVLRRAAAAMASRCCRRWPCSSARWRCSRSTTDCRRSPRRARA